MKSGGSDGPPTCKLEDPAHVGVPDLPGQEEFLAEPLERPGTRCLLHAQRLERHACAEHHVERLVHLAHSTAGDQPDDPEALLQHIARSSAVGGDAHLLRQSLSALLESPARCGLVGTPQRMLFGHDRPPRHGTLAGC